MPNVAYPRPDRAFERRIHTNPEICNHCFSRTKIIDVVAADGFGRSNWPDEIHTRTSDALQTHPVEHADEYGAQTVYRGPRTACAECGSIGGFAHYGDLATEEAVDRVGRLAARLDEQGIDVNVEAMYQFVRHAKSVDELQGRDREIFERAVKLGIKFR